jgi:hypothetical protein
MGPSRPYSIIVTSFLSPKSICQIALLAADGQLQRDYWHAGHIGFPKCLGVADLNHDGINEIYLGGTNNGSSHQATLVVLDPDRFEGAGSESDPAEQFSGMKPGVEIARILFPRSCINNLKGVEYYNYVSSLSLLPDSLQVDTAEDESSSIIYYLDNSLKWKDVLIADMTKRHHHELELEGKLDHSLDEKEIASFNKLTYPTPPHFN